MSYFLGLDVGTSSTKVLLIDAAGCVIATSAPEYAFRTPKPRWAEADPQDWWAATIQGVKDVLRLAGVAGADVVGIGLSGQMHGLVMLDAQGSVLRPCIMWNDQRTSDQCAAITQTIGAERILQLTGNPVLPGFTAPKIVWVRDNEPEVYARCAKVLLPKDYIRYRMSGEFYSEVSDASGTSLLDVAKRQWSDEMLQGCGIPREWMPEVTESHVASTRLSGEAAQAMGLLAGTPIVGGGGDQAAQAVGCGIVEEGIISATFGTSGVVFAHSRQYRVEPRGRLHAFCAAVPGEWHLMGVMLSAAGSLQWYRDALGQEAVAQAKAEGRHPYQVLDDQASTVPAGTDGLLFLPYLTGERTPYPDPYARGAFIGLTLRHRKEHMVRAVLEGVTYGMRDSLELMRELGIRSRRIVASGGGARSPLWRQMMADVFETEIVLVNATEGAAYGAALLATVGTGVYPDIRTAAGKCIGTTGQALPNDATSAVYNRFYPRYRALYPALKDEFRAIGELVE